jgi:hypothetical protein
MKDVIRMQVYKKKNGVCVSLLRMSLGPEKNFLKEKGL